MVLLNYLYKKFLETPTQKRDRKEEELHKQHFILHEMQFRPVLDDLKRFFSLQEEINGLLEKQNSLVKFHYSRVSHYSHINLWVEPSVSTCFEEDSLIL